MTCAAPSCDRPTLARGYCRAHYYRLKRTGTLGAEPIRLRVDSRTEAHLEPVTHAENMRRAKAAA